MPRCFLWLCCIVLLAAMSPAHSDSLTSAMRGQDARLAKRVTLVSPGIFVGELLERLSRQTGVDLAADEWSSAGGDVVTVSWRGVRLADAMDALWSLFSYHNAEWNWRRSGQDGHYAYTLTRADARGYAERLQGEVQNDFEAQVAHLLDDLNLTPDQLQEAAKTDPFADSLIKDSRVRPSMEIFASLLPDTQMKVLRDWSDPGFATPMSYVSVPISSLPADTQAWAHSQWQWAAKTTRVLLPNGTTGPPPEFKSIPIRVDHTFGNVAPSLMIDAGAGCGELCGGGWMEKDWQKKMEADWLLPGDAPDDPASARPPTQAAPITGPLTIKADMVAQRLLRMAATTGVPMVARLRYDLPEPPPATGKTLAESLKIAGGAPYNLQHKWRGGILLVTYSGWFMDEKEDNRLPWSEIRRLRDAEATAPDGFLSFKDLAHAAFLMNPAQLHKLTSWFPVASFIAEWHDFLAYYDQSPEYWPDVRSEKGSSFRYPEQMVEAQLGLSALWEKHPNLRLKLVERSGTRPGPTPTAQTPSREIMFMALDDANGHFLNGLGFGYVAHEYRDALQVDEDTKQDTAKVSGA